MPTFEWDPSKAIRNELKHRVSFDEATDALLDPFAVVELDKEHSEHEERLRTIGLSAKLRVLLVVHTERVNVTRLISARRATREEVDRYEENLRRHY